MDIVEGLSNEVLQLEITNCLKRLRNDDDESIKKEVSELMLKKKPIKKETSLGKIRNINWKSVCIIVTVFILNKSSGVSLYNTYIGNVFISTFTTYLRLQDFQKNLIDKRSQQKKHFISGNILWDKCLGI